MGELIYENRIACPAVMQSIRCRTVAPVAPILASVHHQREWTRRLVHMLIWPDGRAPASRLNDVIQLDTHPLGLRSGQRRRSRRAEQEVGPVFALASGRSLLAPGTIGQRRAGRAA